MPIEPTEMQKYLARGPYHWSDAIAEVSYSHAEGPGLTPALAKSYGLRAGNTYGAHALCAIMNFAFEQGRQSISAGEAHDVDKQELATLRLAIAALNQLANKEKP
jgi:hypothetical protein